MGHERQKWLASLKPWTEGVVLKRRTTWIKCEGVSLHVWTPETFALVGNQVGKNIFVDERGCPGAHRVNESGTGLIDHRKTNGSGQERNGIARANEGIPAGGNGQDRPCVDLGELDCVIREEDKGAEDLFPGPKHRSSPRPAAPRPNVFGALPGPMRLELSPAQCVTWPRLMEHCPTRKELGLYPAWRGKRLAGMKKCGPLPGLERKAAGRRGRSCPVEMGPDGGALHVRPYFDQNSLV
ncbi:hypothetical protein Drorol1_Dr00024798 [Drosera rotundifolia]